MPSIRPDGREVLDAGEAQVAVSSRRNWSAIRNGSVPLTPARTGVRVDHRQHLARPSRPRSRWRCRRRAGRRASRARPCGSGRNCRSRSGRSRRPPRTWRTGRCRRRRRRSARRGRAMAWKRSTQLGTRNVMLASVRRSHERRATSAVGEGRVVDVRAAGGSSRRRAVGSTVASRRGEQGGVGLRVVERLAGRVDQRDAAFGQQEPHRPGARVQLPPIQRADRARSPRPSCASA